MRATASPGLITKRYRQRGAAHRHGSTRRLDCNTSLTVLLCCLQFCYCCYHVINLLLNSVTLTSCFLLTGANSIEFVNTVFFSALHEGEKKFTNKQCCQIKEIEPKFPTENFNRCRPQFCPVVTKMDKMSDYL